MNQGDVAKFEHLTSRIYGPDASQDERQNAGRQLQNLVSNKSCVPALHTILRQTRSEYAVMYASQSLLRLVRTHWNSYSAKQRIEIRNFALDFLGRKGPQVPPRVLANIIDVIAVVAKLGWLEDNSHRELPAQIRRYFIETKPPTSPLPPIGLRVLTSLVTAFSVAEARDALRTHRKRAASFRDLALRSVFEVSLRALSSSPGQKEMTRRSLLLLEATLKYDFHGIFANESEIIDEPLVVNLPDSWRPLLEQAGTLTALWDSLTRVVPELRHHVLNILVRMACVSRNLFTGKIERIRYVEEFLKRSTRFVLDGANSGLGSENIFHEFCRLLARLKGSFPLEDFVRSNSYPAWLDAIAKFSCAAFQRFQAANSLFYVLDLWSGLLRGSVSQIFVKSSNDSAPLDPMLGRYAPKVAARFIISRMQLSSAVAADKVESPLEGPDLTQLLDVIPWLVHSSYKEVQQTLIGVFNNVFGSYRSGNGNNNELEGQLAWLVYIFSTSLGHQHATLEPQERICAEEIDAHLVVRVIQTFDPIHRRLQSNQKNALSPHLQRLEHAVVHFLSSVVEAYLLERRFPKQDERRLYQVLKNTLGQGVGSRTGLLNVLVDKVCKNLKFWGACPEVIRCTLALLEKVTSAPQLRNEVAKLRTMRFVMGNHGPDRMAFLQRAGNLPERTRFYQILSRCLFLTDPDEDTFRNFLTPFNTTCKKLMALDARSLGGLNNPVVIIGGLFRDLRGVCNACRQRSHYSWFFNWFFSSFWPILPRSLETYSREPRVAHTALKFIMELVTDRGGRISFPPSSASGIRLFRSAAQLLTNYARYLSKLASNIGPGHEDVYKLRYRGSAIAARIMQIALSGRWCCFGVFSLYGDKCLVEALNGVVSVLLGIPAEERAAYAKVRDAFLGLSETLFRDFVDAAAQFPTQVFLALLDGVAWGLTQPDAGVSSKACATIDELCAYMFKNRKKETETMKKLKTHVAARQNFFRNILVKLYRTILYEECGNQWSVSRLMLSLMCLDPQFLNQIRQKFGQELGDQVRAQKLEKEWKSLMNGVELNLLPGNRDTFTSNLVTFRANARKFL